MRKLRTVKVDQDIKKIRYSFYVFDTETTKLEPQPKNFVFGVIYGYNYSKVIETPKDFIKEFNQMRYNGKYIFAHNAEFDLMTLFGNIYSNVDNQAVFNGKFISAKYKKITFGDSMNIFPSSVAKIGELLGVNKLDNEKVKTESLTKDNMTKEDIRYCKRDCKIVFDALLMIFEELGTVKLTLSSLSMYLFRNKYLPVDISFSETVDEFYDSYYGGRTEAFRIGKVQASVYDINSMYPYVMVNCQFPDIKHLHKETKVEVKYLLWLLNYKEGLAKVTVRHKDSYFGYLPVRMKVNNNEKLVFPVGTFETTVNFNELRFALEAGIIEILKVDKVVYANPIDSPFIEFINDTYKKRQETDSQLKKTIYKLVMNSLYGRFAMRLKMTTSYYDYIPVNIITELQEADKEYDLKIFNKDRSDCYLITENEKMKNSFFSIPAFSSYITSEARILLLKNLLANEKNKVAYCDTDSIFLAGSFTGSVSGSLGEFKYEEKLITEISGLKNYKYIDENGEERVVIKGISRNSHKVSEGVYEIKKYYKTKGSIRQNKEAGEAFVQTKELRHKYDKRIVLNDGDTKPIKL
jgi:hypothetical protein